MIPGKVMIFHSTGMAFHCFFVGQLQYKVSTAKLRQRVAFVRVLHCRIIAATILIYSIIY
jgi:hypothetical protein